MSRNDLITLSGKFFLRKSPPTGKLKPKFIFQSVFCEVCPAYASSIWLCFASLFSPDTHNWHWIPLSMWFLIYYSIWGFTASADSVEQRHNVTSENDIIKASYWHLAWSTADTFNGFSSGLVVGFTWSSNCSDCPCCRRIVLIFINVINVITVLNLTFILLNSHHYDFQRTRGNRKPTVALQNIRHH